jgi:hypothetical protein
MPGTTVGVVFVTFEFEGRSFGHVTTLIGEDDLIRDPADSALGALRDAGRRIVRDVMFEYNFPVKSATLVRVASPSLILSWDLKTRDWREGAR